MSCLSKCIGLHYLQCTIITSYSGFERPLIIETISSYVFSSMFNIPDQILLGHPILAE